MRFAVKSLMMTLTIALAILVLSSSSVFANPTILMQTTKGPITIELNPKYAPLSSANFLHLVKTHFYDGLMFHRVTDLGGPGLGHIIQGGDPNSRHAQVGDPSLGTGNSTPSVKGEFTSNGVNNPLTHDAGAVAMARSSDPNSGSCQFYICTQECHFLDGNYAVFGKVTKGLSNAAKIVAGDRMTKVTVISSK
jgi:peptidyl-prolyl cis-trans isomerase B (cyclophilin B)